MSAGRKENVELLSDGQKGLVRDLPVTSNGGSSRPVDKFENHPADGGFKAYTVAFASFLANGLIFGIINSYSVIYTVLLKRVELLHGKEAAEIKCALVGSLTIGTTFALSPISGILTGFVGLRSTAVIGGAIATAGLFISSFVVDYIEALWITYGIMFGLGASLCYTPSLAILGQYYKKYLGIVNGIVCIGSSVFTVFMPPLMDAVIKNLGLEWLFRILCIFAIGLVVCGCMFMPPVSVTVIDKPKKSSFKEVLKAIGCIQMWKIPTYKYWALSMPVALFGYFVPYVHIKSFIIERKFEASNNNLPLQCIAVTSAIGRLLFGFLGDKKSMNAICLQQVSFYAIGALTIILPFVRAFWLVVAIALGMGLFEGGFIALIGPIAFKLVGCNYAAQAIGCMLGICALPLSIGPSIAGAIHSRTNDYTLPFVLSGLSPIIGSSLLFLVHIAARKKHAPDRDASNTNGHVLSPSLGDTGKAPAPLLANGRTNQVKPNHLV